MKTENVTITGSDAQKLLLSGSSDAALLYLYLKCGNPISEAERELQLGRSRKDCALAVLRQLGLWTEEEKSGAVLGEPPHYTEQDVLNEIHRSRSFDLLRGELQRTLGRPLNTEDLKIVLGFTHYLGLPEDVISLLVCYCKEQARAQGKLRVPSLRSIEKEAYFWAEHGIDTLEEATAYIQRQNAKRSRRGQLLSILQISGRTPTAGEERYMESWLDMGFDRKALEMAYERTVMNTGSLKWAYMNKILIRWHEAGIHNGDKLEEKPDTAKGASGYMGEAELNAIRRTLQEG